MAYKEQDVVMTTKDADGNTIIQMPITRKKNVEGLAPYFDDVSTLNVSTLADVPNGFCEVTNPTYYPDAPDSHWGSLLSFKDHGGTPHQKYFVDSEPYHFYRKKVKGVWSEWKKIDTGLQVGMVVAMASNSAPYDFLLCNGAAVSRDTYANLFAVIGTTYGVGDGSTTFNLPNLTDRFIQGSATAGTVKSAGLPNIKGVISFVTDGENNAGTGAFYAMSQDNSGPDGTGDDREKVGFDASRYNPIYGASTTVQPPALTMRYYIKY